MEALIIVRCKQRGYYRERHLVAAPEGILSAAKRALGRVGVHGVIVLAPQPGGPLRWTWGS